MNAIRTFALLASLSAGAVVAQAAPVSPAGDHSNWPAYEVSSQSSLSRAEVVAQFQAARQAGELPLSGDRSLAVESRGTSGLSRAAVQADAASARHAGLLTLGDR